jgi:hypothetical protein
MPNSRTTLKCASASTSRKAKPATKVATSASSARVALHGWQKADEKTIAVTRAD